MEHLTEILTDVHILSDFTHNTISIMCAHSIDRQACVDEVSTYSTSVKMAKLLSDSNAFTKDIDDMMKATHPNWFLDMEGHTFDFYEKVQMLQHYADDPRVETICEVGFNAGYSALTVLEANPHASFLSFDIFLHPYVGPGVRALHNMFPERTINVVAGDSRASLLAYQAQNPNHKCNLIIIDGGHDEVFLNDAINFEKMANTSFNRVLIDDIDMPSIQTMWEHLSQSTSISFDMKELERIKSFQFSVHGTKITPRQPQGYVIEPNFLARDRYTMMMAAEYSWGAGDTIESSSTDVEVGVDGSIDYVEGEEGKGRRRRNKKRGGSDKKKGQKKTKGTKSQKKGKGKK